MRGVGVARPFVERVYVYAVGTNKAYAVNDDAVGFRLSGYGGGRAAGGGLAVGEHYYDARIAGVGVEEPYRLAKCVCVVGVAAGHQRVYRVFERVHGGYELRAVHGRVRERHYAYAAAGTNLMILGPAGGFSYDVDKCFSAKFHVGHRRPGHAAGTVEHEDDVGRI